MMAKEMKEKGHPNSHTPEINSKEDVNGEIFARKEENSMIRSWDFVSKSNFISAPSHKAYRSIEKLSGWPVHREMSSKKETLRLGKTTMKFS
jgi:hypothetical protein